MRLLYATTARLPTVAAHGAQIVENCAAFAEAGAAVTLLLAARRAEEGHAEPADLHAHYGVARQFAIERISCLDPPWKAERLQPTAFRVMAATFGIGLVAALRRHDPTAVLYGRDPLPLLIAGTLRPGVRVVFETHQLPVSRAGRALFAACVRRSALVVAVTEALAAAATAAGARATLVARDGFRAERYTALRPRQEARRELGLPGDAFLVGYVGRLHTMGMGKGVERLVDAAALARDVPITVVVVGGPADLVAAVRRRQRALGQEEDRLVAPGQVSPEQVPLWLAALDVGTLPFPDTPHFARCASPLKLFEYLAAGLPIVASDLPALAEVLVDGETALLTPPGDAAALAAALRRLWADRELRARLGATTRRVAAGFTWAARAERILAALRALPE